MTIQDGFKKCAKGHCNGTVPIDGPYVNCSHCRELNRKHQADSRKRKRSLIPVAGDENVNPNLVKGNSASPSESTSASLPRKRQMHHAHPLQATTNQERLNQSHTPSTRPVGKVLYEASKVNDLCEHLLFWWVTSWYHSNIRMQTHSTGPWKPNSRNTLLPRKNSSLQDTIICRLTR